MVPPDSDRISPVPPYSGFSYVESRFKVPGYHGLWPDFPVRSSNKTRSSLLSYNPANAVTLAVWALPRSLATTCGIIVIFSSCGYLDVSVPRVRPPSGVISLLDIGFPHSDIRGSRDICSSPRLFAACHVLLRL